MLVGVATRRYARSLEPVRVTMRSRGTSKVSRRFVAKTAAHLAAWQTASLEALALIGLLIDGVPIGEHCRIGALGIAADRQKHALGLWMPCAPSSARRRWCNAARSTRRNILEYLSDRDRHWPRRSSAGPAVIGAERRLKAQEVRAYKFFQRL